jgi:RNA recognition motif. (a.k.a. RRM, RBD, or RNP domain)
MSEALLGKSLDDVIKARGADRPKKGDVGGKANKAKAPNTDKSSSGAGKGGKTNASVKRTADKRIDSDRARVEPYQITIFNDNPRVQGKQGRGGGGRRRGGRDGRDDENDDDGDDDDDSAGSGGRTVNKLAEKGGKKQSVFQRLGDTPSGGGVGTQRVSGTPVTFSNLNHRAVEGKWYSHTLTQPGLQGGIMCVHQIVVMSFVHLFPFVSSVPSVAGDIQELAAVVGEVKDVKMTSDPTNRFQGKCIVFFARRTEALACIEKYHGLKLDGIPMIVKLTDHSGNEHPDNPAKAQVPVAMNPKFDFFGTAIDGPQRGWGGGNQQIQYPHPQQHRDTKFQYQQQQQQQQQYQHQHQHQQRSYPQHHGGRSGGRGVGAGSERPTSGRGRGAPTAAELDAELDNYRKSSN